MDLTVLRKWFHENHMVLNPGKFHNIGISDDDLFQKNNFLNNKTASTNEEKLLGILLDNKLKFESYITSLCKKAGQKFSALVRVDHCFTQIRNHCY